MFKTIFSVLFVFSLFLTKSKEEQDALPAVPLVVKNAYLSTWMSADQLPGSWPTFWNGDARGMCGMVRVDGITYVFMGAHHSTDSTLAKQIGLKVTPTQSIFSFSAGPIQLIVNFFTPIDPTDLKLMSIPASYIGISAHSIDGKSRQIEVYLEMSGEWNSGDTKSQLKWKYSLIDGKVNNFDIYLKEQKVLTEIRDASEWGDIKFFTHSNPTFEANNRQKLRQTFIKTGRLNNTVDENYRPINEEWPGFAFAHQLIVGSNSSDIYFGIAYVRRPAVSYTVGQLNQLWESYFNCDDNKMVSFFIDDSENALKRAMILDNKIISDAKRAGGEAYVKVVSAALRQAYGGIELVGTPDQPWMMLKEISSDGNCQTVDVIYPHFPVHYYLNPKIIKYLLEPLLDNQEKGFFPHKYCMHDLGSSYPRCVGHPNGKEEAMEVEESANIVIMMSAYVRATNDTQFAKKHYKIAKQWTQFLVDLGLITGQQLTTDDFLGKQINSTNLAIKAIVGIGGMAQMAEKVGNLTDRDNYRQIAVKYAKTWLELSEDPSGTHIKQSYNKPNTWFMIYNLYADTLLQTNLFPEGLYKQQDNWYMSLFERYGLPLKSDWQGTKYDWSFFTAASSQNSELRQMFYNHTALFLRERPVKQPFPDRVDDVFKGLYHHNINRPAIGAVFAPFTINRTTI